MTKTLLKNPCIFKSWLRFLSIQSDIRECTSIFCGFFSKKHCFGIISKLACKPQTSFEQKFRSKFFPPQKNMLWGCPKINHALQLSCRSSTDLLLGNCNKTKVTVLLHELTKQRSQCKEEGIVKNNKNIPQRFIILFLVSKDSLQFPYYLPSLPSIHKYYDSIFIFKGQ